MTGGRGETTTTPTHTSLPFLAWLAHQCQCDGWCLDVHPPHRHSPPPPPLPVKGVSTPWEPTDHFSIILLGPPTGRTPANLWSRGCVNWGRRLECIWLHLLTSKFRKNLRGKHRATDDWCTPRPLPFPEVPPPTDQELHTTGDQEPPPWIRRHSTLPPQRGAPPREGRARPGRPRPARGPP